MSGFTLYRSLPLVLLLLAITGLADAGRRPPAPALYHPGVDLSHYWVRERLRGVSAYWDGHRLTDADGAVLTVPAGFTDGFPPVPLDGVLWMGRGSYGRLLAVVHRRVPDPDQWQSVYFMTLDLPDHDGPFDARLRALRTLIRGRSIPHLRLPPHARIATHEALNRELEQILKVGGAGLILHRDEALYRHPDKDDLLAMRPYRHGAGKVVAIIHNRRDRTMSGLLLRTRGGRRFRLMKGFSDAQRRHPPPLGSIVAFKFYGYTHDGRPRLMHFLRVREEGNGVIRHRP